MGVWMGPALRGKRVEQVYEQGEQLHQKVYGADGTLEKERHFEGGTIHEECFVAPPPAMPAGPYGDSFAGESTKALELGASRSIDRAEDLTPLQSTFLLQVFGPQIQTESVQEILAVSDDGAWVLDSCTQRSSGTPLELLTTLMGDTRVGLLFGQGRLLARIEDGEIVLER
jgi:hypothetical protein